MKRAVAGLFGRWWFGVAVIVLMVALAGGVNALRWRGDGLCGASTDAASCRGFMAGALTVAASVSLAALVATRLFGRRDEPGEPGPPTAVLPGALALTLGIGLGWPMDAAWNNECGYLSGGAPAVALIDRGPFTTEELPNVRDDALSAGVCDPTPDTVWRRGYGSTDFGSS